MKFAATITALLNPLLLPLASAAGGTLARTQRSLATSVRATRFALNGEDVLDYHVVTEPSCPSVECGYSFDGRAHVSENFMNRVKDEAGILPASPKDGGMVQVRLLTKTSIRHRDTVAGEDIDMNVKMPENMHKIPENTPIAFVALNTNKDAYFDQEGTSSVPIVEGSLLVFDGSIEHNTVINSGYVKLLGPFQVPSFRLAGPGESQPCEQRSGSVESCCSAIGSFNCAVCLTDSHGDTISNSDLSGKSIRSGSTSTETATHPGTRTSTGTSTGSSKSSKSSGGVCSMRCIDLDDWNEDSRGCFSCGDGSCRRRSDQRLKTEISSISDPLHIIKALRGVTYYWRAEEFPQYHFDGDKIQIGFIAQELEKILPGVVQTDQNGYKAVDYVQMIALLAEGIKSVDEKYSSEVKELRKEVEMLRMDLNAMQQ